MSLVNPASGALKRRAVEAAARKLGVTLQALYVREPGELESAFATMRKGPPDALIVLSDSLFTNQRTRIVGLATKRRLPAVYDVREFPESGGLMSYGPSIPPSLLARADEVIQ